MNRFDKIYFAKKHSNSVYPRINILIIPMCGVEPMKAILSSVVQVKEKFKLSALVPCENIYRVDGYPSLSGIISNFHSTCKLIEKEYIVNETDITIKDLA